MGQPHLSANRRLSSVLPTPVGPNKTTSVFILSEIAPDCQSLIQRITNVKSLQVKPPTAWPNTLPRLPRLICACTLTDAISITPMTADLTTDFFISLL